MGKASAPEPPDYSQVAQADAKAAEMQFQIGQEQLAFGKEQFERVWPYAQAYLDTNVKSTQNEYNRAVGAYDTYLETYLPAEQQFSDAARNYDTPERREANASRAVADVANQFDAARRNSLAQLESYGVDPSQSRYGALDLGTRVAEAAAKAAAGTQSELNTEATGLGLLGETINIGRGYPGAIAQAYSTSSNAGRQSISAGNETNQSASGLMGSPTSYFAGGNTALGNQASAMHMGAQDALGSANLNYQMQANQASGIGSLIGGIGRMAMPMIFSDRRLKTDHYVVGRVGALPLHLYTYKGDPSQTPQLGFMADEVSQIDPEAVADTDTGYQAVDYHRAVKSALNFVGAG